jgi:hypothetical protein
VLSPTGAAFQDVGLGLALLRRRRDRRHAGTIAQTPNNAFNDDTDTPLARS